MELSSDNNKSKIPTFNMKNIQLYHSAPKKIKNNNNILNDTNLLINNNKNALIHKKQDSNFFYRNNSSKITPKENRDINRGQKYWIKRGIPIKNLSTTSKNHSQFGSFSRNSQSKIMTYKTSNITYEQVPIIKKAFSPILKNKKKIKWNQYGILNLSQTNFKKAKIKLNIKNSTSIIEKMKYKKRIKGIKCSFSLSSFYNKEQRMIKDNSCKNFLYDNSLFSNSNMLDSPKKIKSRIYNKKRNISPFVSEIKFNDIYVPKKKEYQLIIDNDLVGKLTTFTDLPDDLKKMNIKSIKNLERDNKKLFNRFICIIDRKMFKQKYQNPFTSPFEKKIYEVGKNKEEEEEEKNKNYINDEVLSSNQKLLKDMDEEINIRSSRSKIYFGIHKYKKKKRKYNKNELLEKFKYTIINLSKCFKNISVSLSEIIKEYKLPKICYTYRHTKELIFAIKTKNLDLCNRILDNHKYIVLDYDYYFLTPLHWAVKKNFYEIIPKLIEYGSIINFQNFIGDTPLHVAVKQNYYECVSLLLVNLASPFMKDKDGRKPIDLTEDFQMKKLLEKIMNYHYLSLFKKNSNQFEFIQKKITLYITDEFSRQLNKNIILYFKEKEFSYKKK